MADAEHDAVAEYEALKVKYEEKCQQEADLLAQLRAARLDVQQLGIKSEAAGVSRSLVPDNLRVGGRGSDLRCFELQSLLRWVSDHVDIAKHSILDVGYEVSIAGRQVSLRRTVQWRLNLPEDLKLSVPVELYAEVVEVLQASRARGAASEACARRLAESWEIVVAEIVPAGAARAEPAVFLVHVKKPQAMLVATWPSSPAVAPPRAPLDLTEHFGAAVPAPLGAGAAVAPRARWPATPNWPASRRAPEQRVLEADPKRGPLPLVLAGDRVEVEYEGSWFTGVVQSVVDGGLVATVQCDVDLPDVLTTAPITSVRLLGGGGGQGAGEGPGGFLHRGGHLRHARSKSAM